VKDESGFTFMETLCAIALILACAGAAGGLAHSVRRITGSIQERSNHHYQQLKTERLVREAIEGVTIPYWEQDERSLLPAKEAVQKVLQEAGYRVNIAFEPIQDSAGRIRGLRCRYQINDYEYDSIGLFASVPLVREKW